MFILGISAFYHDSAAALIKNGQVVFAAEEERFSRVKHDNAFPFNAIKACLAYENILINDISYVTYYEKPLLKFERILQTFVETYPFSFKPFIKSIPEWIGEKIKVKFIIKKRLGYKGKIFFIPHHLSHASAAFYPSPFKESAILTADATGEYQTTSIWYAKNNDINLLKSINFPHSLGLFYSTFTSFLRFRVNEDEYKVMGLAAFGKPRFVNKIHEIVDIKSDGSFHLDMKYFAFRESFQMWSKKFERLFGKPRNPKENINQRHKDLAASIQKVTEEIYFKILNYLYSITKTKNLCVGGGVALNALANGKIYEKTPFKNVYIFGAAGDSGGAIGATLFTYRSLSIKPPRRWPKDSSEVKSLSLGSSYDKNEIEIALKSHKVRYQKFDSEDKLLNTVVSLLNKDHVIGWFQGRMEFGPRALGNRSILAKPNPSSVKNRVNKIKIRELFRPFAGSILQEKVHEYFDVPEKNHFSPFMTFCFKVKKERSGQLAAIVHKDGTCRIQTVSKENGRFYRLIMAFYKRTGIPCILNTSFNLKGEPIIENPEQAIKDFLKTKMDCLCIGDFLVLKRV